MDNAATELGDTLERRGDVVDLEVRQREAVARTAAPLVNADGKVRVARLPAGTLARLARLELGVEQPAPERPRALDVVGGELDQSGASGVHTAKSTSEPVPRIAAMTRRRPSYYLVAGVDLRRELERLRALPVFAGGPLAARAPELKVRRSATHPVRLGFAVPSQWRLSVTAYPEARAGDVLETLLHELVHLHVGRGTGAHAWHGREFKSTLATAMAEAYGVTGIRPRNTRHGVWAEAIEKVLRAGPQLELRLAS